MIITPPSPQGGADVAPCVAAFSGELDLAAAPEMHHHLSSLLESGAQSLVVDLRAATFIDSTALGVLVTASSECQSAGGRLHLIVTSPQIQRVLSITGLTEEFAIHTSPEGLPGEMGNTWK